MLHFTATTDAVLERASKLGTCMYMYIYKHMQPTSIEYLCTPVHFSIHVKQNYSITCKSQKLMYMYMYMYMCIMYLCTCMNTASSVPQASNKLEQIQHRIMSYDEQWPALRRWYQRFRNLGTVNSNMDTERVYTTARDKVQEVINKV